MNVDCPHLYHVIIWLYTLIVGVLKYFLFGGFVRFDIYPLDLLSYGALVHFGFSLSAHVIAWRECWLSTPLSCDHRIVHLDCWSIKIFSLLGVLSALIFILLGLLSYGALVHFGFPPSAHVIAWRECWLSTPVWCNHGIVHLDCWSIKIFSLFGGFVRFDFYPLDLLSYPAFIHFGFSLSAHVIAWRECWFSTSVSCDHGIVHLDCWSIKIFSLLGVLSALIFILWIFCPMVLLSILAFLCPLMWRHDENVDFPQVYHVIMGSYTLIVGVLKYFLFWDFVRFNFYPIAALVIWCFSPFWLFSVRPSDRMTRMLIVHTCIMWSWNRTPWFLEY